MEELTRSMNFQFKYWVLQTVAFMITCFLIPRLRVSGPIAAFFGVVVLGFVNAHYWNAAFFYQIPMTLTLGTLLLILVNGIIFFIIIKILPGLEVYGLLPALAAPVVFSLVSLMVTYYGANKSLDTIDSFGRQVMNAISNSISGSTGRTPLGGIGR